GCTLAAYPCRSAAVRGIRARVVSFNNIHRSDHAFVVAAMYSASVGIGGFVGSRPMWSYSFASVLTRASRRGQKLKSPNRTIGVVEHSTEPLVPSYSAVRRDRLHWNNETILESLMVPLQMIMRHKLANRIPQRVFTKEDHLPQAILPNRSDEP